MPENPRRGRQARNFTTNVPKILDLKSCSEQIFFRKLSLGAPENNCRTFFGSAKRWPRPLNRGLISHSFIQLFWDFDYWPLNEDSTVLLSVVRGILGLKTYRQFYTR